jgi:hypothetical protein
VHGHLQSKGFHTSCVLCADIPNNEDQSRIDRVQDLKSLDLNEFALSESEAENLCAGVNVLKELSKNNDASTIFFNLAL